MRYTEEKAREVLAYLLTEVQYNPGIEFGIDQEGRRVYRGLDYYLAHGYPKKPRYGLTDGDYAVNEYGLCTGYYKDRNVFVAFDNSTRDCWVEEFELEEDALGWLKGDYNEPEDFKGTTSLN